MFPSKQVPSWIPFLGIWQGQDGNRTHKTDLPLTSGSDWRTSHEAVPLLTFLRALFTKRAQELQRHSQAAASRHGVFHPPRGKVSFGSLSSWEGPCRHYPPCWIKRITLMLQWKNLESWRAEWKLLYQMLKFSPKQSRKKEQFIQPLRARSSRQLRPSRDGDISCGPAAREHMSRQIWVSKWCQQAKYYPTDEDTDFEELIRC